VLGLGRGGEDGLAVVLEDLQPVVDVLRMAHGLKRDTGLRAQEGGTDLGHQFLEGIAQVTEAGTEHPVQPGRVPGPVTDFVKAGGVVEVTVLERGPVRQEHQVRRGQVTGLVAAMLQLRQGQHPLGRFIVCSPAVHFLRVLEGGADHNPRFPKAWLGSRIDLRSLSIPLLIVSLEQSG